MEKMESSKSSLSKKISVVYCSMNIILIAIITIIILFLSTKIMRDEVADYTSEIIKHTSFQFNNYLDYSLEKLSSIYRAGDFPGILNKDSYSPQEMLYMDRRLNESLQNSSIFDEMVSDIIVVGNNGYTYNTQDRMNLNPDYNFNDQGWYKDLLSNGINSQNHVCLISTHKSDYYDRSRTSGTTFSMAMLIADNQQDAVGSIIFDFDISRVQDLLMSGNYEKNGYIYLLDSNGGVVCQSNNNNTEQDSLDITQHDWNTISTSMSDNFITKINGVNSLISYQTTNYGWKIVYVVPIQSLSDHNLPLIRSVGLIFIVFIGINILTSLWAARIINRPVNRLVNNINQVDSTNLKLTTSVYEYNELNKVADKFNVLLQKLNDMINKDYLAQIQINKMKLNALESQLNPHFLMNTLQLLQTEIICDNVTKANQIVVKISRLLRYSLYNQSDEVAISDEIGYVKDYLALLLSKYEGRLSVNYDLDTKCESYYTPKMILQPIIENCFTHAFSASMNNAIIQIVSKKETSSIIFEIKDNGEGLTDEEVQKLNVTLGLSSINKKGIGIANIHQRIRLIYGEPYGLTIDSQEGNWTKVTIRIPLLNRSSNETIDTR